MSIKQVLRDCVAWGLTQIRDFYAGLEPSDREKPSTQLEWNAKDHLGHISHWIITAVERTRKARLGEDVAEVDDIDQENERIYHIYRERSWDEILAELEAGFETTLAIVESLSEAELTDPSAAPWAGDRPLSVRLVGNTVLHPLSHLTVYYKVQKKGIEFAQRYDEQALPLLEQIGESGMWRGTIIYNAACFWALAGDKKRAIKHLAKGLDLAPNLKEYSKQDGDLDSLRTDPGYQAIYEA